MIINPNVEVAQPMKIIDMSNKSSAKAYLTRDPKDTHSKSEMDAVLRAINYTKLVKQQESLDRMNEEEVMERPLPGHGTFKWEYRRFVVWPKN